MVRICGLGEFGRTYGRWEDDEVIGAGEGEDWEDEVDRELEEEEVHDGPIVKTEIQSPVMGRRERRTRVKNRELACR